MPRRSSAYGERARKEVDLNNEAKSLRQQLGDILILEDEPLVSVVVESILLDMGASRVHICSSPGDALEIVGTHPLHLAILDVIVGNDDSFGVADALAHRGIPYFFASATTTDAIDERHRDRPLLTKPFSDEDLIELVRGTTLEPALLDLEAGSR